MTHQVLRRKTKAIILNSDWKIFVWRYQWNWTNTKSSRGLPWWGVECGESYNLCVLREIYEETWIHKNNLEIHHTFDWYFYHYFNQASIEWIMKKKNMKIHWEKIKFFVFKFNGSNSSLNLNIAKEFVKYNRINASRLKFFINANYNHYLKLNNYERIIGKGFM